MSGPQTAEKLRGTQSMVGHMGWVFDRPWLTAREIAWRWLFGIPMLALCGAQIERILEKVSLESSGLASLNAQNPWQAAAQIAHAWGMYRPLLGATVRWLVPVAAFMWVVISGVGRSVVWRRLEPSARLRVFSMMVLQAMWLALLGCVLWGWYQSIAWVGATDIPATGEPDLIGFAMGFIFFSLGFFTAWALVSWPLTIAPVVMLMEECGPLQAAGRSLRLGKTFIGKLIEVNLVMGIVTLALIVLSMVLSAAPLPFSDELGPEALDGLWVLATVFYFLASDYFQVVRLKGFVEFWKKFRGSDFAAALQATKPSMAPRAS
jgi:hypothetical protein